MQLIDNIFTLQIDIYLKNKNQTSTNIVYSMLNSKNIGQNAGVKGAEKRLIKYKHK